MAEETKPAVEEQGPPPWEMDLNPVVKYAVEAVNGAAETVTTAVKGLLPPWKMDLSAKRPIPQVVEPAPTQQAAPKFEQVFSKLINAESRGKHTDASGKLTTSSVGAQGITQLMPETAKAPGFGIKPVQDQSEGEYLRVGRDYLRAMLNEFGGDYEKAVAAYNAGHGSVKKAITQATKKGGDWKDYLPKKSETLPYLNKILGGK